MSQVFDCWRAKGVSNFGNTYLVPKTSTFKDFQSDFSSFRPIIIIYHNIS